MLSEACRVPVSQLAEVAVSRSDSTHSHSARRQWLTGASVTNYFFAGVCANVLAAADFSALVDDGSPSTLPAFDAAFGPVCPLLLGAWESALAAADFSAAVDLGFDSTLLAFEAAFGPV
ncbi:hypothetical protein AB0I91_26275 [Actinosynnema sp. NPDC049800]